MFANEARYRYLVALTGNIGITTIFGLIFVLLNSLKKAQCILRAIPKSIQFNLKAIIKIYFNF